MASSASAQPRRSARRRAPSPPASSSQFSPAGKRQRRHNAPDTDEVSRAETIVIDSLGEVPAALRLIQAIKQASVLGAIGYSPSKVEDLAERMMDGGSGDLSLDDVDREHDYVYSKLTDEDKDKEDRNNEIVVKLREVTSSHAQNSASGILDKPFRLRIARRGIKFDESIAPRPQSYSSYGFYLPEGAKTALDSRLKQWHRVAEVSGYGDVRDQVTKVDKNVRQAKEISASEFSVDPELLERIADLWDQNFFPNTGVRVEPYKIHLYGPGDHFSVHRDTPQQGLVGTFLLGLGDTSSSGGLAVDGVQVYPAYEGHWCAFYPDVPHKVEEIDGYRSAIAFKLFRTSEAEDASAKETDTSVAIRQQVSQLVGTMEPPFGILLQRKYCLGTTSFSGSDAVLINAARALHNVEVRHFPIVLQSSAEWGDPEGSFGLGESYDMKCSTTVYPFTKGHVDALIEYVEHSAAKPDNHSACGAPWLEGVEGVPFFSLDLEQSLFTYQEEAHESNAFVGNEVEMCREDSIYLSYALLVLPKGKSSMSGSDDHGEESEA